jgi:hypothetical protein
MDTPCPDCGTENYDGARFCRKCGRTLIDFAVSEATTRSLEERERAARMYAEAGDRPRYVAPSDATPPGGLAPQTGYQPAAGTNPLQQKAPLWPIWVALSVALIVFLAVGATFFVNRAIPRAGTPVPTQEPAIAPPAEEDVEDPDIDVDVDPDLEDEDSDSLLSQVPASAKKWVYPGSTVEGIDEIPGGMTKLSLSTDDDFTKVVKFYRDRMPDALKKTEPGEAKVVGSEAIVTIQDGGDGSTVDVLVNPGGPGFIPPIPPIPAVPTPPAPPAPPAPRPK